MSDPDIRKAAAMLLDSNITKKEVAKHFRVSRTTLNASLQRYTQTNAPLIGISDVNGREAV
jgi:DNA-binding transcriptional regulator LsrR (DeoR family)